MGVFEFINRKKIPELNVADDAIVAIADGEIFDITEVKDAVFADKLMGGRDCIPFYRR